MRFWSAFAALMTAGFSASPAAAQSSGSPPITNAQLETKARDACGAAVTISPEAIQRADFDGDGRGDVLFNWRHVSCQSASALMKMGAGNCGMHNCSIDVYLSSQYRPDGWPKAILNHMEVPPRIVRDTLRTATQGGSCKFAHVCQWEWRWNGSKLVSRPIEAGGASKTQAAAANLPVTIANVTGIWAEAGDKCATDFVLAFQAGGQYASYEENGDWRLVGDRIAVVIRETYTLGDAGSTQPVPNPKARMLTVKTLTADKLVLGFSDGTAFAFRRCG